ncbi:MAG: hypothetical protein FWD73_08870 [Polyangiaceae bacterium]|nr:hypothetical protein [Polyangiaceae bacterium]
MSFEPHDRHGTRERPKAYLLRVGSGEQSAIAYMTCIDAVDAYELRGDLGRDVLIE